MVRFHHKYRPSLSLNLHGKVSPEAWACSSLSFEHKFQQKYGPSVFYPWCVGFIRSTDTSALWVYHPSAQSPVVKALSRTRLQLPGTNSLLPSVMLPPSLLSNLSWKPFSFHRTLLQIHCLEICVCVCVCVLVSPFIVTCVFSVLVTVTIQTLLLSNSYLTPQLSFPSTKACIVNLHNFIHTFIPRLFFHTLIHACYYFL